MIYTLLSQSYHSLSDFPSVQANVNAIPPSYPPVSILLIHWIVNTCLFPIYLLLLSHLFPPLLSNQWSLYSLFFSFVCYFHLLWFASDMNQNLHWRHEFCMHLFCLSLYQGCVSCLLEFRFNKNILLLDIPLLTNIYAWSVTIVHKCTKRTS